MKRHWLIISGIGLLAVLTLGAGLAGCASGGGTLPSNLAVNLGGQSEGISVTGLGEISAVPDVANISLGVSAQAKTVAEAQAMASGAMNKLMTALTQGGVAAKDIQTQVFNIQQLTRYDKDTQKNVVIGYQVTNTVLAKVRDMSKTGAIIDAVAVAGGDLTRINGIAFAVDNPSAYYADVRQKAMTDANTKARQLANLGGVTLGKPTYIAENLSYPVPRPVFEAKMGAASAPTTPISPGETKITLSVQVVYAIPK